MPYIFSMILYHLFFIGLVLLLFQAEFWKKNFSAFLLMAVMASVQGFSESFLSCFALFLLHTVKKIPEPSLSEWESGLIVYASFAMVILAVSWMSKHLAPVFDGKPGKWYALLAFPMLAVTVVADVANWGAANGIMVRSGGNMGLYYDQIFSHMGFCLLTALSMFAAGGYVFGMERVYLEQRKSSQYHAQIAVYKMLEEQHSQSERLRHDMKNHIITLSGLCQNKEWEKITGYLQKMQSSGLESGGDITGNKAVDALLYQKRKRAEQEGIRWECDVQIPKTCSVHEFGLCVLFGNLLDNALEACGRIQHGKPISCSGQSRFINIQAKTVKNCFLLEVKNSMDPKESYEGRFSGQKNLQGNGIGLLNVRDVADQYDGAVDIEARNGVFVVSILIPQKVNAAGGCHT